MMRKATTFCGLVLCITGLAACGLDSGTGTGNRPPASNNSDANNNTNNTSANNQTSPSGNNATSPTNNQTSPPTNNTSNSSNNTTANNQSSPPPNNQMGNNTSPRIIDREGLFGMGVDSVTLEIDYQAGAEPYTSFGILGTSGARFA